ncbi:hypothetical protein VNO80_01061 [Phaseolus coccineus]|uniref:Uncharacterized protein n=1 Tax=Phaseolus coccineus TaxID=3886 RepID=A0AAN9NZF2_PHACN
MAEVLCGIVDEEAAEDMNEERNPIGLRFMKDSLCYAFCLATHASSAHALSFANPFSKFASKVQNKNNKWVSDINIILLNEPKDGNHEKLNLHEM